MHRRLPLHVRCLVKKSSRSLSHISWWVLVLGRYTLTKTCHATHSTETCMPWFKSICMHSSQQFWFLNDKWEYTGILINSPCITFAAAFYCILCTVRVMCVSACYHTQRTAEGSVFLAPSVCVFCLCMKYLRNRWMDLRQIHTEDVFGPSLG